MVSVYVINGNFHWGNWSTNHQNIPLITLWQMEQQEPYLLPINYICLLKLQCLVNITIPNLCINFLVLWNNIFSFPRPLE